MADNAIELARVFLTVVPSFEGAQNEIAKNFIPQTAAGVAGSNAGAAAGTGFATKFKTVLAPLLTAAAVGGAFKGLYSIGETFDTMVDTIRIGTGAAGADLEAMAEIAKTVGSTVPTTFEEAGQTVADWNTRMGLTGDTLQKVASQTEMLKSLDMAVDINKASAAFNAFNITGDAVVSQMDNLFRISQSTGAGIDAITSGVKNAAPALNMLGFSFEESAAMVGLLDKAGLNSQQVMMGMTKSLTSLAEPGETVQESFKRVAKEIQGFISKGDEAAAIDLAGKVFGTRGAPQMIAALTESGLKLDDLIDSANLTGDTIMGVGAETADFAENWQLVKNNAALALEPLGSAVFSALGVALEALKEPMQSVANFFQDNPVAVYVLAGALGTVLVAALVAVTASVWSFTVALLANPVTWVVVGIMALVAAIVALWANWDSVTAWVSDKWSAFTGWIKSGLDSLAEWWNQKWSAVTGFFSSTWGTIKTTAVEGFDSLKKAVSEGISKAVELVSSLPGKALAALGNVAGFLYESGASLLRGFADGITAGFSKVTSKVKSGLQRIRDFFPFSPAKEGPFSGKGWVFYSGLSIGDAMAEGIERSARRVVDSASSLAARSQAALAQPGIAAGVGFAGGVARSATRIGGGSVVGSGFPSTLVLRVGDREFTAYLEEIADGRVNAHPGVRAADGLAGNIGRYSRMMGV